MTGLEYDYWDAEVNARKQHATKETIILNAIDPSDEAAIDRQLHKLFGSCGDDAWTGLNFNCDCGKNIHVGDRFIANYNVTILDIVPVHIGNDVMIGPGACIITVNHPLSPKGRRNHLGIAKPVTIGNDVWIGANCTILPGVTIGDNVVVAAGAVVTHDVPDNCLVAGVPARKIRDLENDVEDHGTHGKDNQG